MAPFQNNRWLKLSIIPPTAVNYLPTADEVDEDLKALLEADVSGSSDAEDPFVSLEAADAMDDEPNDTDDEDQTPGGSMSPHPASTAAPGASGHEGTDGGAVAASLVATTSNGIAGVQQQYQQQRPFKRPRHNSSLPSAETGPNAIGANGAVGTAAPRMAKPAAAICPPHPGFIGGMCMVCGALQPEEEAAGRSGATTSLTTLRHLHERAVHISRSALRRLSFLAMLVW